jgi:4-amino-4-deoxy-L-arabinose transferase-like glycosyltransferase
MSASGGHYRPDPYVPGIVVLIALRFAAAAVLPLSADEAYYWLWSKHLAAGYYDHPPAIAFLIRMGTAVFGDSAFGVRAVPVLLSVAASWFVWRAAALVLRDAKAGGLACLLFNLTLVAAVETMAATPDAPLIACSAAFLVSLAKVEAEGNGKWWLAAGVCGGLALMSKYTAFFLGAGALAWLVFTPAARRWLATPWPYAGLLAAFAIFAPNLSWNAAHGWMTFRFQFGRVGTGPFTLRFLAEFAGAQLLLASPFVLAGAACALAKPPAGGSRLLLWTVLPAAIFFAAHSLHQRVQGNWPCFLYPALAVAAADALRRTDWSGAGAMLMRWCRGLAIPSAAALLGLCYVQAFFGLLPLGGTDPFARLLAFGFPRAAQEMDSARRSFHAAAILTTDYETTAWLAFYSKLPVVQINEDWRWQNAKAAPRALLAGRSLYVTPEKRDRSSILTAHFGTVTRTGTVERMRAGAIVERYSVYGVAGLKDRPLGRMP